MDQQLENKNKYYGKRLSLEQEIMDLGKSQLIDDTSDFRDDSKYHFEIKYCQPHKLHRGDEDTSLSTFQIGMNNLQCQPVKDASFNPSFSRILQEEVDQTKSKHKFSNISTNYQAQSKNDEIQEQQIKNITLKINDNIKLGLQEEEKEYERSFKDNNQGAKNLNVNIQSKMQPSSNDTQCNSINNSRFKLYSHILIQDDIFYEKDDKKLGTKVELALKSQYKIQHTFNNSMYKQNLQKAASIIRFLFSSSINRVSRIRQDVKSFITFLKLRHSNRNLEDLSEQEFLSVQDLSHFYSQKRQNHQSYQVLKILVCLLKFAKIIPTFMPSNMIRVIWDLSVLAFTYIFLYVYSLLIFLDENYFDSKIIQRFNFLAFTIFVIDILVSLNTAFYDKDTIITKRIFIARKYFLSSMFITDFISMFILGSKIISSSKFILYNVNISEFTFGLNMLIFLKANGISSKKKRFDYVFTLTENQKHVSKLINQLATVITVAHFAALGWYFVGVQEAKQNEANWLEKIGIRSISVQGQYVYAIYWAITTMTTGLFYFNYENQYRDKLQEDKILCDLSHKLRDEITLEINSKILNNYHLFNSNFSKQTLNKLIFVMKEVLVNPNEIIINENQCDDSSIYFIQNGIIEIYQQQIQKLGQITVIQTLRDGQIFGDISFFTGLQRNASARSVNLSTLYKITRDEFLEILKENKEDFEHFKQMQDQMIFQREKSIINNSCYFCKDSNHIANQCPRTHKLFDKQFLILKHNFSMFQQRVKQEKISQKLKYNAKKQFKRNLEVIKDFQKNSQFSSGQSFLECDKNESSMYDTVTHNSNNEDDNNDESYTESQIEEENQSIKKSVTNLEKEKIDKTSKSIILKTDKSYRSNADETELQVSQENQIQRFYSNLVYENQDPNKMASKYFNSQAMFKSFEVTDSIDSINQESQKNISNQQKITQEQNKVQFREEIDTYQYNRPEKQQQQKQIAQSEKEKSNQSNSRVFDKQKPSQLQANFQQGDQQKNQIFKSFNNISQDNYIDNNQFQQSIKLENNKKNSSSSKTGSNSKGNSFQKSQMLANQNNLDKRNSVEISFSNIATLLLLQGKNISSQQQNSANYFNQDKSIKNYNSSIEVNDQNEQISSILTQKNNGSSSNNLTKQKSENKLKSDQYNQLSQKYLQNEDLQIIDRLSKILQNSQLPLLLQLTNGKNLQSADNLCVQNTMDYFDKMQCFKKYYTDYNFDRVIRRLKIIQQEQKKNKKAKPSTKEHHQNMGFTPKASIKQQNTSAIKSKLKEFDINQYKPTFLSYGTKMQKRNIYPINYFNLVNN
ncbi:hypothetical protein ABPG73_008539 [Tetrahymena malaccensis]